MVIMVIYDHILRSYRSLDLVCVCLSYIPILLAAVCISGKIVKND